VHNILFRLNEIKYSKQIDNIDILKITGQAKQQSIYQLKKAFVFILTVLGSSAFHPTLILGWYLTHSMGVISASTIPPLPI